MSDKTRWLAVALGVGLWMAIGVWLVATRGAECADLPVVRRFFLWLNYGRTTRREWSLDLRDLVVATENLVRDDGVR